MLLYDVEVKNSVKRQIPTLDEISRRDPEEMNSIVINLPNYKIRELLELSIYKYKDQKHVNGIISNAIDDLIKKIQLQHHTTSLTFKGEERIRKDVLLKLKSITEYLETLPNYPILTIQKIKQSIGAILGSADSRTKEKYLRCFQTWLRKAKGQESFYNSNLDLSGFKQAVLTKMENPLSMPNYAQIETQKGV